MDILHRFLYQRECLVNDVGDCPCHLTDIHCDTFYITTPQCWYGLYQYGSTGRNCVMEGKDGGTLARLTALALHSLLQKGQPCVTGENTVTLSPRFRPDVLVGFNNRKQCSVHSKYSS